VGRQIAIKSTNHLGGYTNTETELDFAGVPKLSKTYHKRLSGDTERVITETFTYDSQNRLLVHKHKVDNNPEEILAQNTYNDLSQLTNKKVGGTVASNPLQSIDYLYNIRGWMMKINDPKNLGNKLFGYEIKYNTVEGLETPNLDYTSLKVLPRYNGNIAEVDWKTGTVAGDYLRRYGYVYDRLNRLSAGFYQKDSNPSDKEYFEKMDYDVNGNITSLKRSAQSNQGAAAFNIDELTYAYANNNISNRLTSVTDSSTDYRGYPDTSGITIPYDVNGNMISQKDKGMLQIDYNFLNLPYYIKFDRGLPNRSGRIYENTNYLYRADGTKLRKIFNYAPPNPLGTVTQLSSIVTEYLDGFQYESTATGKKGSMALALKFVPTSEGYYNFENNKYIYNYTDHLGNIRLSYFNNGSSIEVLEENNYYPFGMKHEGYNGSAGNPSYQYKYNGKELQTESGMYDYGARFYMADIGRWGVVDELAEKFNRHSPYNYVVNDPINGIDSDGRDVIFLADSKAVPVAGHGAVIVGNERDGWYYYSMNGTGEGSKPYGDSKNPDIGTPLGKGLSPKQAMLAASKVNPDEQHHYDKFVTVKTSKEEDVKIKAAAAKAASAKKYKVIGQSCACVMLDALNELTDIRSNNAWYIPKFVDPAPNNIIDFFNKDKVGGINHLNRFFLPADKEIQTRKVGKLEVGPLIPDGVDNNKTR